MSRSSERVRGVCLGAAVLGVVACAAPPLVSEVAPVPVASSVGVAAPPAPPSAAAPTPVVPDAPKLDPLAEAPCRIKAGKQPTGVVRLRFRGIGFATFENPREAELRMAETGAILAVDTDDVTLVGEVEPKALSVAPNEEALVDGYVRPLRAHVDSATGDRTTLWITPPPNVAPPHSLTKTYPCSAVSLGARPGPPQVGKPVDFADGLKAPLVATPGGPQLATIVTPPKPKPTPKRKPGLRGYGVEGSLAAALKLTPDAVELGRRGGLVQVRILGHGSEAEGFVPASALRKPLGGMVGILGALSGMGGLAETQQEKRVRCESPVTIYLRRANEIAQIGQYKPKGLVVLPEPSKEGAPSNETPLSKGELRVTLGDPHANPWADLEPGLDGSGLGQIGGEASVAPPAKPPVAPTPFVRAEAVRGCALAAPPAPRP